MLSLEKQSISMLVNDWAPNLGKYEKMQWSLALIQNCKKKIVEKSSSSFFFYQIHNFLSRIGHWNYIAILMPFVAKSFIDYFCKFRAKNKNRNEKNVQIEIDRNKKNISM